MRLRPMVLGMAMAAMACGEAVGPPTIADGTGALEFHAAFPRGVRPADRTTFSNDLSEWPGGLPLHPPMTVAADVDPSTLLPLIFSSYVAGEFIGRELWVDAGFYGVGTGFSQQATVRAVDAAGIVKEEAGMRYEEAGLLWGPLHPHIREPFTVSRECGVSAEVPARFEARTEVPTLRGKFLRAQDSKTISVAQAVCPPPNGSGGPVLRRGGTRLYLCQYELWTDADGDVIDVNFYGCTEVSGEVLAM